MGWLFPDGHTIALITSTGGVVSGDVANPASFSPVAAGVSLAAPFSVTVPNAFSHQWTSVDPRGGYQLFLVALKAGAAADGIVTSDDFLAIAAAPFSLQ